jgi:hypothetical protein
MKRFASETIQLISIKSGTGSSHYKLKDKFNLDENTSITKTALHDSQTEFTKFLKI